MRRERILKAPRRRRGPIEPWPLVVAVVAADTSAAQDVLDRIDQILEIM